MNKILIISIIVIVGIFIVGFSIYDTSQETDVNVKIDEDLDSQKKSYSIRLTESVAVNTP